MKKLLCLLMICVLFLCGCGKEKMPVNADFGGTLSLSAYEDDTINPLKTKYKTNAQVFSACMHRGLLKIEPNHEIGCDLAESYSFSDDKTFVTFKLKDALFSDGTKISAQDVISALDSIRENNESMYHIIFDFVDTYSATGGSVTLKLFAPNSGVLAYMNFPVVKETDGKVIGAGYYKLDEIQSDRVLLSAVSDINTNFEIVTVMMYPKQDMAENAFLSNEIDIINADYSNLARLQGKTGVKTTEYVSDNLAFVGFNTQNEILSDVNVRRAIACAIDKKDMAEVLMAGYAKAVNSPFKPDTVYGNLYAGEYQKDIDMLNKYLAESELKPGDLTFKILVNKDSITKKKVAQYLSKSLNEAGMNTSVEELDFENYITRINAKEYTIFIGETTVALNQDFGFLAQSGKNFFGYESAEADMLLERFRSDINVQSKKEVAKQLSKHFVDNLPFISLYYQVNSILTDGDISGEFSPMQTQILGDINLFKVKK